MTAALFILNSPSIRQRVAALALRGAPDGSIVEFRANKRSTAQNARLHAMLTEVARQVTWHGAKLTVTDWKRVFSAALKKELRMVPNLTGDGFVMLGERTSRMTKAELGELMDLIEAWGAQTGVTFSHQDTPGAVSGEAGPRPSPPQGAVPQANVEAA